MRFRLSGRARGITAVGAVAALVGALFVWGAAPSFAVHDNGMFELDGNIVHNAATTQPYDWASLFGSSGQRLITPDADNGPLLADVFVSDAATPDPTYFSSNKDLDKIGAGGWGCGTINNPTNKDDILNTYAALVQVPANAADNAGHNVLYMASERDSNNGDSFAGFWLLKDHNVGCSGSGDFSGQHTDGDILVVSNYTNGGGTQDVEVYRWTGNNASGSPVLQASFNGSVCGGATNDNACAIANAGTITSPWSPTSHDSQTFVEVGIDLNVLLGQDGGCFTNFLSETRSSQEITATLKDFAGGQFNTCPPPPIATTATPGGVTAPGTAQHDVATISAVGTRPAPTGTITFTLCTPAQVTAAGCPQGSGTAVGSPVTISGGSATSSDVSGATDTAPGKYCWGAAYTPDASGATHYVASYDTDASTECFTVQHFSPTISTTIAATGSNPGSLGLTTLGDSATLSGYGPTATSTDGETITFKLWGPYPDGVTPTCAGSPVFTTTGSLSSGVATTSQTYDPTQAGTYVWTAAYPGDGFNSAIAEPCNQSSEKIDVVGAMVNVVKSANPPGPVSAGEQIGFDIAVSNTGAGVAANVHVADHLPAGGDLNWALDPAYTGCAITGPVGTQVLNCTFATIAGQTDLPLIHVSTPTSPSDCGLVSNTAVITSDNAGGNDSTATVRVNCALLTATKTADHATVNAGASIGFTVGVTNSNATNTGTAKGVTINDPLPGHAGVTWSIDTQSGGANCHLTGSAPTQTLVCGPIDLAPGAGFSVHVTSATVFASCATYDNTAHMTATNAANQDPFATTQVLCPALDISKSADAAVVNAGTSIGFTVTAHNTGAGAATGTVINDPLPTGTGVAWTVAGSTGGLSCGITANTLSCTGTFPAGGTETVHITSPTTFESCGVYNNTGHISSDVVTQINSNQATVTVLCSSLGISKTADDGTVNAGEQIGFTVTATNTGDGDAVNAVLSDALPAGSGVSWTVDVAGTSGPLGCAIASGTLTCTGLTFAAGATEIVHVTSGTTFSSCGVYDNTASLSAGNAPAVGSNKATTTVLCPNLHISKTADAPAVDAGTDIGFTVTASNTGLGDATGTLVHDVLPTGSGISWSIDAGGTTGPLTCDITAGVLSCTGTLGAAATEVVHVTSSTVFASCGTYDNTATVHAANGPEAPTQSNKAETVVNCPDVAITKVADHGVVNAGDQIGFTVSVSNSGVGTATGVVVNDPLPAGDGVSWSIDTGPGNCSIQGDAPNQTLICTMVDLATDATETIHIVSATVFASCGLYDNMATATVINEPGEFQASDSVLVLCANLTLTKTADAALVDAGSSIGFTVSADNADNENTGTAYSVTISDPLPAGSGVNWSIDPAYDGPGTCEITGEVGSQTLSCALGDLGPGDSASVHVTSGTEFASCAAYPNEASLLAANAPGLVADATTTVQCPSLVLAKTALTGTVAAGTTIGFKLTETNGGPAIATGATLNDPLPSQGGLSWSISPAYAGPGTCDVTGAVGSQLLACAFGDLAAGQSVSVTVSTGTTAASCALITNSATGQATNAPPVSASANTNVLCPLPTSASKTPSKTPLAATGAGPVRSELFWAIALIVLGFAMTIGATTLRRRNRAH